MPTRHWNKEKDIKNLENMKAIKKMLLVLLFICWNASLAQELGANFNHNAEIIDFEYLEKVEVNWVRTTPRIIDYVNGELSVENDPALQKVIEAGKKGYKIAFGFRWDFKMHNMQIPASGSSEEKKLFDTARQILHKVGPYVDIFKLGNEPNLETLTEDMKLNSNGKIPLLEFTNRFLYQVVLPYFKKEAEKNPDIYVGSFPALFEERFQKNEAVLGLLEYAQNNPDISGLSLHLHIEDTTEIDEAFKFVRKIVKEKPIIIPEFSLHRLYRKKLPEPLNSTEKGEDFAIKYNHDPEMKLFEWFSIANTNRVDAKQWDELFESRHWFTKDFFDIYFDSFQKYRVVLATYPLFQQSCPENMTENSPAWFINPIFCQKSLEINSDGDFSENPLWAESFKKWVRNGKNR